MDEGRQHNSGGISGIRAMMRHLLIALIILCPSLSWADTHAAADCEYATVAAAVAAAAEGDTVTVPAGSCTWGESLVVTVPMTIQGAGSSNTIITGSFTSSTRSLIEYDPPGAASGLMRITGFDLDGDDKCIPLGLLAPFTTANIVRNVRVDHNILRGNTTSETGASLYVTGNLFGVVDNNVMYGKVSVEAGAGYTAFDSLEAVYGNADNLYIEDNTITHWGANFFTSGHGSRYAARYNTLINTDEGANIFDGHGNMKTVPTNMIIEGYGNSLTNTGFNARLGYIHGGKNLLFYNKIVNDTSIVIDVLEMYDDGLWNYNIPASVTVASTGTAMTSTGALFPTTDTSNLKVKIVSGTGLGEEKTVVSVESSTAATLNEAFSATLDNTTVAFVYYYQGDKSKTGRVQHVNDSYFWGNRAGDDSLITVSTAYGDSFFACDAPCVDVANSPATIAENSAWWQDDATFDGTTGVGCGTLASRPATCTTGVAYWATNQSCSDLTGMVGAASGRTATISGTLYKCTATNTWTSYYQPYAYPHPLRGVSGAGLTFGTGGSVGLGSGGSIGIN